LIRATRLALNHLLALSLAHTLSAGRTGIFRSNAAAFLAARRAHGDLAAAERCWTAAAAVNSANRLGDNAAPDRAEDGLQGHGAASRSKRARNVNLCDSSTRSTPADGGELLRPVTDLGSTILSHNRAETVVGRVAHNTPGLRAAPGHPAVVELLPRGGESLAPYHQIDTRLMSRAASRHTGTVTAAAASAGADGQPAAGPGGKKTTAARPRIAMAIEGGHKKRSKYPQGGRRAIPHAQSQRRFAHRNVA